ncbi:uncharacterized protein LOC135083709 [Ostrinia nubilalis]|uniref:uncharacterized protein LOC135083709 n=1 Tax=Ostrinia nubilalis TaxID=29057 RepID=UPI00308262E9
MERNKCVKAEDLDINSVVELLEKWDLAEFVDFVKDRRIDGRKLLDVTEGIVKLWQPKVNAKKFILFIENFKLNPEKYLGGINVTKDRREMDAATSVASIESQYQTVKKVKTETTANFTNVEELLKKIVPAKSFLYRNQQRKTDKTVPSYVPMDGTRKPRKFFRLSSYEYPNFDLLSIFSRQENVEDRGYYSVKSNTRYYIQKTYRKQDTRTKYKSLQTPEELSAKLPEDHFYEDLCYNEVTTVEKNKTNPLNQASNVKPCLVKLQELFQSFKMPFSKKPEITEGVAKAEVVEKEREANVYENAESISNMYDSVHVKPLSEIDDKDNKQGKLPVEDYLEPVQLSKEYCDVAPQRDDSLLGYIMSIFDTRFGFRRETSEANQSDESEHEDDKNNPLEKTEVRAEKHNMADRPLPVPVENEPYYMNVERTEAENLLRGQPDGTFILRPSSQPNHAYTLTVSCANAVHNVGVRRRPDGRLALGYARRGERSFASVPSLLRHHRRRRLLLVAAGGVIGATTLNETPHYYQTPSNIPVT